MVMHSPRFKSSRRAATSITPPSPRRLWSQTSARRHRCPFPDTAEALARSPTPVSAHGMEEDDRQPYTFFTQGSATSPRAEQRGCDLGCYAGRGRELALGVGCAFSSFRLLEHSAVLHPRLAYHRAPRPPLIARDLPFLFLSFISFFISNALFPSLRCFFSGCWTMFSCQEHSMAMKWYIRVTFLLCQ
ncbi:hypothetical protein K438DRAFT_2019528 [Mycena galopus ATCC 62051]|nr:hypothetical protein K438DRAFT_2019528 [Mycena galopus ATCC 62051]